MRTAVCVRMKALSGSNFTIPTPPTKMGKFKANLVRFAHNLNDGTMRWWNIGSFLHRIEKKYALWDKPIMDRKNINIHGKTVKACSWHDRELIPMRQRRTKSLDPNTEVMRFWPLFHDSNIPLFHVRGTKPVSAKATWFQYIIEIPRRF